MGGGGAWNRAVNPFSSPAVNSSLPGSPKTMERALVALGGRTYGAVRFGDSKNFRSSLFGSRITVVLELKISV